ncbi:MAG TPA: DUF721 domain-containing protein [Vicinamibacteria bacterium]
MTFEPAGAGVLARRLFRPGSKEALALLRSAWPQAVGRELARRTRVEAVEGTTLRVRVPDAGWRAVLHRVQPQILARLRSVAGDLAPRRLGFDVGAVPDPPAAAAPAPPPPAACPVLVVQGAQSIRDPEIRGLFVDAAARYLARARHS